MDRSDSQPVSTSRTRWVIWLSLAAISVTAAVASYLQALIVIQAADGRTPVSYFVAGLADPTIFAATANLIDAWRRKQRLPRWSMVSLAVALLVTAGLNVAAGSPHDVPSWLVRIWPPAAFIMALESLASYIRRGRGGDVAQPVPAACDHPEPVPPLSLDEAIEAAAAAGLSKRRIALDFECGRPRVDQTLPPEPKVPELAGASLNGGAA